MKVDLSATPYNEVRTGRNARRTYFAHTVVDCDLKRKAAVGWCHRINGLVAESRFDAEWHYVLLGEDTFYTWRDRGGSMADLMAYAKLRPVTEQA